MKESGLSAMRNRVGSAATRYESPLEFVRQAHFIFRCIALQICDAADFTTDSSMNADNPTQYQSHWLPRFRLQPSLNAEVRVCFTSCTLRRRDK
jgi:hypothetical protein